jgi:hypothetical protein
VKQLSANGPAVDLPRIGVLESDTLAQDFPDNPYKVVSDRPDRLQRTQYGPRSAIAFLRGSVAETAMSNTRRKPRFCHGFDITRLSSRIAFSAAGPEPPHPAPRTPK